MSISNLEPGTTEAVHMRCPSSSGGKDWVGSITSTGELNTYWGKTGHISQHAAKPATKNGYINLISEKTNKGYVIVDRFEARNGWESQQPAQPQYTSPNQSNPSTEPFVPTGPPLKIVKDDAPEDIPGQARGPKPLVWDF